MLHEIDDALQRFIADELGRTPGCPIYDFRQVTLDTPGDALRLRDGDAYVNLYLYDVRENIQYREEGHRFSRRPENGGEAGTRPPLIRLDLSYLVTVHAGGDPRLEHRLLGDLLRVLFQISALPPNYLTPAQREIGETSVTLQVSFPGDLSRADLSSLWQAMDGSLRPAAHLVVTLPFEPGATRWAKIVRESPRVSLLPSSPVLVTGIVLDAASEAPLSGAVVALQPNSPTAGLEVAPVESGTDGVFILPQSPPGTHSVRVSLYGYRPVTVSVSVPPPDKPGASVSPLVVALRRVEEDRSDSG